LVIKLVTKKNKTLCHCPTAFLPIAKWELEKIGWRRISIYDLLMDDLRLNILRLNYFMEKEFYKSKINSSLYWSGLLFLPFTGISIFVLYRMYFDFNNDVNINQDLRHAVVVPFIFIPIITWYVRYMINHTPKITVYSKFIKIGKEEISFKEIESIENSKELVRSILWTNQNYDAIEIKIKNGKLFQITTANYSNIEALRALCDRINNSIKQFKFEINGEIESNIELQTFNESDLLNEEFIIIKPSIWNSVSFYFQLLVLLSPILIICLTNFTFGIVLSVFTTLFSIGFCNIMNYFEVSNNYFVVKNYYPFWRHKIYSIKDIKKIEIEVNYGAAGLYVKLLLRNNKLKKYLADTLERRDFEKIKLLVDERIKKEEEK
jgi:hypothetical protein